MPYKDFKLIQVFGTRCGWESKEETILGDNIG